MSQLPFYLGAFVIVLGVLIVIHELGHYTAARLCGVKVLRFSVGFGPVLWQRCLGRDQTAWSVSALPLGGYVRMLDEREAPVDVAEQHRAFNRQTVGRRSFIVAAGPLANFSLAILLYWAVFMAGSQELLPILGGPPDDTPAAMAQLANGDQVRRVDGEAVATWSDLRWALLHKAVDQESADLEVMDERGLIVTRRLFLASAGEDGWEGDALERLGIRFYRPELPPVIGRVVADGPGEAAGLQPGDRVLEIDQKPIAHWHDLVLIVRDSADIWLQLTIERDGELLTVDARPEGKTEQGRTLGKLGIAVADGEAIKRDLRTFVSYSPLDALFKAVEETWDKSVFSLVMLGKMLTGEVSLKNLSGPVTIADYAGQSARLGIDYYLKFMAMVSISLGVLNLLPIPVLDGGHLMYYLLEVVRRRPLSERAMEIGQRIGLSILFALMAFAFLNDINRLLGG